MTVSELIKKLQELDGNKNIKIIAITPEGNSETDIESSDIVDRDIEYAILSLV